MGQDAEEVLGSGVIVTGPSPSSELQRQSDLIRTIQSEDTLFQMLTKLWANDQSESWKRDPDRHWESQARKWESYIKGRFQERHNPFNTITSLMFNPNASQNVDEDTLLEREWPSVMVRRGKTLALLRTVFGESKLPAETSMEVGSMLLHEVRDNEIVEVLENGSEANVLESPTSPNDEPDAGGFVTEDLEMLGLDGSEVEEEKGEIVETSPGGKVGEKRKASGEKGGDAKRMKGANAYPLQSGWESR
jgi:hypothetical protein